MKPKTITGEIYEAIFELLEAHKDGLQWTELKTKLEEADSSWHPKTINGCIWKLLEKYPEKVHKPAKGLFQLTKYK